MLIRALTLALLLPACSVVDAAYAHARIFHSVRYKCFDEFTRQLAWDGYVCAVVAYVYRSDLS